MKSRKMSEAETDAREILEGWQLEAEHELAYLNARRVDAAPVQKEENLQWNIFLAKTQLENIPRVLDAAVGGNAWHATFLALYVGMRSGQSQAESNIYHARREIRLKVKERSGKGGRAAKPTIKDRQDEALRIFRQEHDRFPKRPYTTIVRQTAQRTGYVVKTIRRLTKNLKW
jgi:hypothetical protein